jgi:hypothetical protein
MSWVVVGFFSSKAWSRWSPKRVGARLPWLGKRERMEREEGRERVHGNAMVGMTMSSFSKSLNRSQNDQIVNVG